MKTSIPTEPLTDTMITALAHEAGRHGDVMQCYVCEIALGRYVADVDDVRSGMPATKSDARRICCAVINDARAQDDDRPFVRVVP